MDKRLTIVVEGPDIIMDLIERALKESNTVHIIPETILPGYVVRVCKEK